MVKVSASREITTPWNFILDPLGTERRFTFRLFAVCLVETCAETSGAIAIIKAKPQIMVNGRTLLIALLLIISSLRYLIGMPQDIPSVPRLGSSDSRFQHRETKQTFFPNRS